MATSSKVQFKLETLKEQALEAVQERIEISRREVESYTDESALQQRIADWRSTQEERVSSLFRSLGGDDLSDGQLAAFKIHPLPSNDDQYERRRAERSLADLQALEGRIRAKSSSLVADESGNISLTKTQLTEFFGL